MTRNVVMRDVIARIAQKGSFISVRPNPFICRNNPAMSTTVDQNIELTEHVNPRDDNFGAEDSDDVVCFEVLSLYDVFHGSSVTQANRKPSTNPY